MENSSQTSVMGNQAPLIGAAASAEGAEPGPSQIRDLFTDQTGQVLLELGNMIVNIPPFNDHIDRNTGELLISIGNKLRMRK
jgi:hypothetical protein